MRKIKPIKSTGDENVGTAYGEDVEKEIPSRKGMAGVSKEATYHGNHGA